MVMGSPSVVAAAAAAVSRRGQQHHYQDVPIHEGDDDEEGDDRGFHDEHIENDLEEDNQNDSLFATNGTRRRVRGHRSTRSTLQSSAGEGGGGGCTTVYYMYLVTFLILTCLTWAGWKMVTEDHATTTSSSSYGGGRSDDDGVMIRHKYDDDDDENSSLPLEGLVGMENLVHYDPYVALHPLNPFDLEETTTNLLEPPVLSDYTTNNDDEDEDNDDSVTDASNDNNRLGYMMQPDIVNNTCIFVSEGDLYLTRLADKNIMSAIKLTTTVGNVRSPKINPTYPYWIAYTATYTGRREVYLLDLRGGRAAVRLTYWDTPYGISQVVGWKNHGMTLIFSAEHNDIGMPDTRLYELSLQQDGIHPYVRVWQIQPVPLTQAMDGVFMEEEDKCVYFTRFAQSSNTIRYVGGTAESLWAWCQSHSHAIPLTLNYRGTSKTPTILTFHKKQYLLFLSDRLDESKENAVASSMNLWAMPLLTEKQLYDVNRTATPSLIRLTQVSCDFDGKSLIEYAVDPSAQNVVLRIGADLHLLKASTLQEKLEPQQKKTDDDDKDGNGNNRQLQSSSAIKSLDIRVHSDFHEHQERLIPVSLPKDVTTVDVYETVFGATSALLGLRGQLWVCPVYEDIEYFHPYAGAGMNLPLRRYRVAPGTVAGGAVRILAAKYVPLFLETTARRLAVVLATDPKSPTAEHGFYLVETQAESPQVFVDVTKMPDPFLGGHVNGGSVANGGLGTVNDDSVSVSPCGRRLAWTDRDGRICVMTLPLYRNGTASYEVLPQENEQGEPIVGTQADLSWSPGGRYLAISHSARNQFTIISIADCGDPTKIVKVGRIVQATPDRFNSVQPYWGKTALDFKLKQQADLLSKLVGQPVQWPGGATTLYFLSDRDIVTDVPNPFGTRGPSPHFPKRFSIFALPLVSDEHERGPLTYSKGIFGGGGASELWSDNILAMEAFLEAASPPTSDVSKETSTQSITKKESETTKKDGPKKRLLSKLLEATEKKVSDATSSEKKMEAKSSNNVTGKAASSAPESPSPFPQDREIELGAPSQDLSFARRAYRLGNIPPGHYRIISQATDDPALMAIETVEDKAVIKLFSIGDFPSDSIDPLTVELPAPRELTAYSLTTTREHIVLFFSPDETVKVVPNSAAGLASLMGDPKFTKSIADVGEMALSVWPALEYQQMYDDAWRMLRDYFYDTGMNGVDWPLMHSRYRSLVKRCAKREELDDVLKQLASELSALHVFVYGGEYGNPLQGSKLLEYVHQSASLGATFVRSAEWKGYVVSSIPERDPDFNLVDGKAQYSPLSSRTLQLTGQRGLEVGDVIVGVNGESVMRVPDIRMLLRGTKGRSVRLEVLRLASGDQPVNATRRLESETIEEIKKEVNEEAINAVIGDIALVPEPVITVPISQEDAADLRYDAWEWQTREKAKSLAKDAGFTVGYVHLKSMAGPNDADAFFRGFYPDYNKDAMIIDVRHNRGGNIDSWLLDVLQRKAWMYWQDRTTNITNGGLGWDEQFAFRGHLVVLIDEHTSSDGEGFSRGVSELGLGKLIGKRTWGGGIWLSSDNHLVDGGIATAPEVGTYNDKFGWGLGIEQMGVEPDYEVDNDPHVFFTGKDQQLEYAINHLAEWLKKDPIVLPKSPGAKRDMSITKAAENCAAN